MAVRFSASAARISSREYKYSLRLRWYSQMIVADARNKIGVSEPYGAVLEAATAIKLRARVEVMFWRDIKSKG